VFTALGLRRGAAWARRSAYAVIGWFATVPVSVAAMAITMVVRDDPEANGTNAIGLSVAAIAFLAVAVVLYRPLLTRAGSTGKIPVEV
jgi:hypothetical protein